MQAPRRRAPLVEFGAAIVLAGGSARRLGGVDKPGLVVAGRSLLDRALQAVAAAPLVVLVGPDRPELPGVRQTREEPAGSGPAAALTAGMAAVGSQVDGLVVVIAADLPTVGAALLNRIGASLPAGGELGALAVDPSGRRQYLLGVWPAPALRQRCTARDWAGGRLADLLDPIVGAEVALAAGQVADIDTPDDLARWQ